MGFTQVVVQEGFLELAPFQLEELVAVVLEEITTFLEEMELLTLAEAVEAVERTLLLDKMVAMVALGS
jgi:hypothetical protein